MSDEMEGIREIGEKKAFEHAAILAREYRNRYKQLRFIVGIETVIIIVMYILLLWR